MDSRLSTCLALALVLLAPVAVGQIPVDLSAWIAESYALIPGFAAGVWTVAPGGASVTQSVNGVPTVFYGPFDAFNFQAEGQIVVNAADDDYIGFALGFEPGDATNPFADYLLVDWKRATQAWNYVEPSCTPGTTAYRGLAVSRVTGVPTADELWGHVNLDTAPCSGPGDAVVELARGATLGGTGWVAGTTYTFGFSFTATRLQVFVNGTLEIDVSGLFHNGRFAFYNFSQGGVAYSAYTVSSPASRSSYGTGHPGTLGIPGLTLSADPVLGTTPSFELLSANPSPATAFVAVGFAPTAYLTPFGGTLWVVPADVIALPLDPGLTLVPLAVPADPVFAGAAFYLQLAHLDPGASQGLAFTPGLEIVYGY